MDHPTTRNQAPEEIRTLLDDLTPYYRQMMESLPVQQRKALCALAQTQNPMRSTDLAREARLEPRAAATALTRLRRKGMALNQNRRWQVADPWLALWYRTRRNAAEPVPDDMPPPPPAPSPWDQLIMAQTGSTRG